MKKLYAVLSVILILTLFSVTVLVRAGDMPPIPLTTAPQSSTPTEVSTEIELPVDPQKPTAPLFWISETSLKMYYKSTAKLNANGKISWSSTNEDVVKVSSDGTVTAVGVGRANVKAVSSDGRTRTCTVRVRYSLAQWCIMILLLGWLWGY